MRTVTRRFYAPHCQVFFVLLGTLLLFLPSRAMHAQPLPWGQEQMLTANDAEAGIGFGDSAALDEGVALVGATANGLANLSAGAVYVLNWNETDSLWQHTIKLTADDGDLDDRFGWSLDISGDVVVIGAPDDSAAADEAGSVYVFRRDGDTWQQEQKLTADDGDENDHFGRSVGVSGDVIVVGAPDADGDGGPTGAVYVFRWDGSTWQQEQKIQIATYATIADLGAGVAVWGERLLIGVAGAGPGGQNLGAAYVFRWDETEALWQEQQRLSASDEDAQDKFGSSVDLRGDLALIGVPQDEDGGAAAGAAYVFRWDEGEAMWLEEQKLLADDTAEGDRFGLKVALGEEVALIGAPDEDNDGGNGSGAAYVYEWNGTSWEQTQKLAAGDAGIGDHFGESVAVGGDRFLIGASNSDDGGESAGSAYVFRRGAMSTAVEEGPDGPSTLSLQAYPNPFRQQTKLSYELSRPGWVQLAVYDLLGRQVTRLTNRQQPAGEHTMDFDAGTLPAGVYVARLETEGQVYTSLIVRVD